jgi:hypothetical protein
VHVPPNATDERQPNHHCEMPDVGDQDICQAGGADSTRDKARPAARMQAEGDIL